MSTRRLAPCPTRRISRTVPVNTASASATALRLESPWQLQAYAAVGFTAANSATRPRVIRASRTRRMLQLYLVAHPCPRAASPRRDDLSHREPAGESRTIRLGSVVAPRTRGDPDRSRTSLVIRTHGAGNLRAEHAGQTVTLAGWVGRRRDHGGVAFVDLRDASGVAQVVVRDEILEASGAHDLRNEFCIAITGT